MQAAEQWVAGAGYTKDDAAKVFRCFGENGRGTAIALSAPTRDEGFTILTGAFAQSECESTIKGLGTKTAHGACSVEWATLAESSRESREKLSEFYKSADGARLHELGLDSVTAAGDVAEAMGNWLASSGEGSPAALIDGGQTRLSSDEGEALKRYCALLGKMASGAALNLAEAKEFRSLQEKASGVAEAHSELTAALGAGANGAKAFLEAAKTAFVGAQFDTQDAKRMLKCLGGNVSGLGGVLKVAASDAGSQEAALEAYQRGLQGKDCGQTGTDVAQKTLEGLKKVNWTTLRGSVTHMFASLVDLANSKDASAVKSWFGGSTTPSNAV